MIILYKISNKGTLVLIFLMTIPFFQSIQAGFPSPATDNLKQDMHLDEYLVSKPNNTIYIKVA